MKSIYDKIKKEKHVIIPFSGIDHIKIEESRFRDAIKYFGEADIDNFDDRGNREIIYKQKGLSFKCLKALNNSMIDPNISFIKINRSFKSFDDKAIFPGLNKLQVNMRMKELRASVVEKETEIWEKFDGTKMKFFYNEQDILESIIIF